MKKPDGVYLFPTYYIVNDTNKGDEEARGCAVSSSREIRLSEDYHLEDQKQSMLHEVIHLILEMGGYREQDEQIVDVLSLGILSMIRGNSDLIKWLEEVK